MTANTSKFPAIIFGNKDVILFGLFYYIKAVTRQSPVSNFLYSNEDFENILRETR